MCPSKSCMKEPFLFCLCDDAVLSPKFLSNLADQYFYQFYYGSGPDVTRIRNRFDISEACHERKHCFDSLVRALQASRVVHSPPNELGTLLAMGSEIILQGAFHPSSLFYWP